MDKYSSPDNEDMQFWDNITPFITVSLSTHLRIVNTKKGSILDSQKRFNPGLTPGASRRETGLAGTQASSKRPGIHPYHLFPYSKFRADTVGFGYEFSESLILPSRNSSTIDKWFNFVNIWLSIGKAVL